MLEKNASEVTLTAVSKPTAKATASAAARGAATVTKATVKTMPPAKLASILYYYQAIVRAVYDGDTITVDIDLGMHHWVHGEKIRLLRINAPELRGATHTEGEAARDFLRSLVDGKEVVIETYKDDKEKYGRYLAEVWVQEKSGKYTNVNDRMVKEGHAVYKEYA